MRERGLRRNPSLTRRASVSLASFPSFRVGRHKRQNRYFRYDPCNRGKSLSSPRPSVEKESGEAAAFCLRAHPAARRQPFPFTTRYCTMKPKTLILMVVAVTCGLGASYMTSRLLAERQTDDTDKVAI